MRLFIAISLAAALGFLSSCSRREVSAKTNESPAAITVGTTTIRTQPVAQHLTLSSELVPFQEIDVYAKEAGYVKELNVDYGSHVRKGQVMAVLEVPELEAQLQRGPGRHPRASRRGRPRAERSGPRQSPAQRGCTSSTNAWPAWRRRKPGLVAQQEVDDAQGKDLAAESQVEAAQGAYQAAQSQLVVAKAKLSSRPGAVRLFENHRSVRRRGDAALCQSRRADAGRHHLHAGHSAGAAFGGESVPAGDPGAGVVRANTSVSAIRWKCACPRSNSTIQGKVARFSVDVNGATRTMHTEVDVPNAEQQAGSGTLCRSGAHAEPERRRAGGASAGH